MPSDPPTSAAERWPKTAPDEVRRLAVKFMSLPRTRREAIIDVLLGPQAWADVTFAGEWAALLKQVRERGLLARFAELVDV